MHGVEKERSGDIHANKRNLVLQKEPPHNLFEKKILKECLKLF